MADYSKAFDTVTYSPLIKKLKVLKFSNSFIDLITDYLSDRQQFVQIDDRKSPNRPVKLGVPQGSILEPTLFNIYVHDFNDEAQSSTIQFADDSTFYKSFKATQVIQDAKELENDLKSIQNLSNQRNLILHATETKSMLFSIQEMSKRHKLHEKDTLVISSNDKEIECVKSTALLGINFNENLKWDEHVNEILKTLYYTLRTLRHLTFETSNGFSSEEKFG